jgi:hypothetical protein
MTSSDEFEKSIARMGEAVDHLVTAPISNWTILKGLPLDRLYAAARRKVGGPLSVAAARTVVNLVSRGDTALLITGFLIRDYGRPETDGPIGAAVAGRAIALGLGGIPVAVSEEQCVPAMQACFEASGLIPADLADMRQGRNRCVTLPFPLDEKEAEARAAELLDELQPKVVIAVERPGAGHDGRYHGGGGFDISHYTAKTDALFSEAQRRGISTIGIGDLGNELGMGTVAEEVRSSIPFGETIAAELAADVVVVANISNWGAYGVAACIAALTGVDDAFHDGEEELGLIDACIRAGAIDPVHGLLRPYVDGTDAKINAAMVDMLRSVLVLTIRGAEKMQAYRDSWRVE